MENTKDAPDNGNVTVSTLPFEVGREELLIRMERHCKRVGCDRCPYSVEADFRDVSCGVLFAYDENEKIRKARVAREEAERGEDRTGDESRVVCKLLEALRKLFDVNLGKHPKESMQAYEQRKMNAMQGADDAIAVAERFCRRK